MFEFLVATFMHDQYAAACCSCQVDLCLRDCVTARVTQCQVTGRACSFVRKTGENTFFQRSRSFESFYRPLVVVELNIDQASHQARSWHADDVVQTPHVASRPFFFFFFFSMPQVICLGKVRFSGTKLLG